MAASANLAKNGSISQKPSWRIMKAGVSKANGVIIIEMAKASIIEIMASISAMAKAKIIAAAAKAKWRSYHQ
jgi:hypothetical protein